MNTNYKSLREIADNVYEYPICNDMPLDFIIKKSVELIKLIGAPLLFENRTDVLHIERYRSKLPCQCYEINQVALVDTNKCDKTSKDTVIFSDILTYDISTFGPQGKNDLTYKLQGDIIYISKETADIAINYKAIAVDKEGFPLISDNAAFARALEDYIIMKWLRILWMDDKIKDNKYVEAKETYENDICVAQSSLTMPSEDQMESISRLMNSILVNQDSHNNGFSDLNKRNTIRVH